MIRKLFLGCALALAACIIPLTASITIAHAAGSDQAFYEQAPAYTLKHPASMSDFFQMPLLAQLVVAIVIAVSIMALIGNFITTRNHSRQRSTPSPLSLKPAFPDGAAPDGPIITGRWRG